MRPPAPPTATVPASGAAAPSPLRTRLLMVRWLRPGGRKPLLLGLEPVVQSPVHTVRRQEDPVCMIALLAFALGAAFGAALAIHLLRGSRQSDDELIERYRRAPLVRGRRSRRGETRAIRAKCSG
jgi:hypothetical protein